MRPRPPVPALLAVLAAAACAPLAGPSSVVIDIGHTPEAPGATAASGATEHALNDRFARRLGDHLSAAGLAATRTVAIAGPDPLLDRRAAAIADHRPCLIVSIHHDSVQERYLRYRTVDGVGRSFTEHAAGYSLFVPTATPPARDSLLAARAIADALVAVGEQPSLHHAEPIEGEGRRLLDPGRGIYAGDFLKILRVAAAPAVLVEVGVIKNPADETRLSQPPVIDALAGAIAGAVASLPLCPVTSPQRVISPPAARTAG